MESSFNQIWSGNFSRVSQPMKNLNISAHSKICSEIALNIDILPRPERAHNGGQVFQQREEEAQPPCGSRVPPLDEGSGCRAFSRCAPQASTPMRFLSTLLRYHSYMIQFILYSVQISGF